MNSCVSSILSFGLLIGIGVPLVATALEPCRIEIHDDESGWPVPLVELRTVSGIRYVSDDAGIIACDAPELMDRETWFYVQGQGYGVSPDGFGYEGIRLKPQPGGVLRVPVTRRVIARRVGRITGSGLYSESTKLGEIPLVDESGIIGCDSVQTTTHNGQLHWVWGDSNLAHYPLGIFEASGATSPLTPLKSLEPPLVLPLNYFRDSRGRPRSVSKIDGRGPTWLDALISLEDAQGQFHLVASYVKVDPPLSVWQRGLCEWNEQTERFEIVQVLWTKGNDDGTSTPIVPSGHSSTWQDEYGQVWALFGNPFPTLKMRAKYEHWCDPASWQTVPSQAQLMSSEGLPVKVHSGSIAWNAYRNRWVTVFMEAFGTPAAFGELWYAESKSPWVPWGTPVKVLSHQNYSFYNPQIHTSLVANAGQHLFFEGTYTILFAGTTNSKSMAPTFPLATPRYEYNQILYRLDLNDPRLRAAQFN